ncbi:MAG: hypothetical protein ABIY70_28975 [Capsulimonas sp.]|uniref:hypothetical protein n=1 Tax=Capsulimonas sp. TaxID=2494211 RepID=UPI00326680AF
MAVDRDDAVQRDMQNGGVASLGSAQLCERGDVLLVIEWAGVNECIPLVLKQLAATGSIVTSSRWAYNYGLFYHGRPAIFYKNFNYAQPINLRRETNQPRS